MIRFLGRQQFVEFIMRKYVRIVN